VYVLFWELLFAQFTDFSQEQTKVYPTLSRIALDVLPAQASSVPCERLFSAGKEIADDRRSRLGAKRFEQLQMLKFEWQESMPDYAAWNSEVVDNVQLDEFMELLEADAAEQLWDSDSISVMQDS
jgi:hypothetical protein